MSEMKVSGVILAELKADEGQVCCHVGGGGRGGAKRKTCTFTFQQIYCVVNGNFLYLETSPTHWIEDECHSPIFL